MPLWHFHAVHHSVKKLWFFNTGRFHIIDTLKSMIFSGPLLALAGTPNDVVMWFGAITAYIGFLTHVNIRMKFGWLNYIFNTPELHRWHHSTDLREGNKNYGENLMIWDLLFRTFYDDHTRPLLRHHRHQIRHAKGLPSPDRNALPLEELPGTLQSG